MVVKIDLSHLPVGLKSIIVNSQEFSLLTEENHYDKNDDLVCLELPQENRDEIIKILTVILSNNNIDGLQCCRKYDRQERNCYPEIWRDRES